MSERSTKDFLILRKLYKFLNQWYIIEIATIIIGVIGIVGDFFLTSEEADFISTLGSIVFVIWTFTVSLIVFYLGRMEDKHYGIRIVDILIVDFSFRQIIFKVVIFMAQLILLLVAVVCERKYTLIACTISQIIMMLYVFVMVCVESSGSNIRSNIKENIVIAIKQGTEERKNADEMLYKMIFATDYKDRQARMMLIHFFQDITEECNTGNEKNVQNFTQDYMEHIIQSCEQKHVVIDIVNSLLVEAKTDAVRRGLVTAVLCHSDSISVTQAIKPCFEKQRSLILWALAFCLYNSKFSNMEFLRITAVELQDCIMELCGEGDAKADLSEILEYWIAFVKGRSTVDTHITNRFYTEFNRLEELI